MGTFKSFISGWVLWVAACLLFPSYVIGVDWEWLEHNGKKCHGYKYGDNFVTCTNDEIPIKDKKLKFRNNTAFKCSNCIIGIIIPKKRKHPGPAIAGTITVTPTAAALAHTRSDSGE